MPEQAYGANNERACKKGACPTTHPFLTFRKIGNQALAASFVLCDSFSLMRADLPERSRR